MSTWSVQLKGGDQSFDDLVSQFRSPDLYVTKNRDGFELRSSDFDDIDDSNDVRDHGVELIKRMNGVAKLFFGHYISVEFGGSVTKYQEDGTCGIYIYPLPAIFHLRASAAALTWSKDDPDAPPPLTVSNSRVAIAKQDERVGRALRLFGYEHTWDNLYKIYEVIEEDVGSKEIRANWPAGDRLNAFTSTANNPRAVGDAARHGHHRHEPPKNPLSLHEAQRLIRGWLRHWLEMKTSEFSMD